MSMILILSVEPALVFSSRYRNFTGLLCFNGSAWCYQHYFDVLRISISIFSVVGYADIVKVVNKATTWTNFCLLSSGFFFATLLLGLVAVGSLGV